MIQRVATAILCALLALGAGCKPEAGSSGGGPAAGKTRGTIGLSVLTMSNPFFKVIADTMREEAAKHGFDLIAVSGDNDVVKQSRQIDDFIVKRVSAIVLNPCDSKSIVPAIRQAASAGIPVFTADIACLDPSAGVVSHIATDNEQGGRLAAQAVTEAVGKRGKVAILDYPEVESCILRVKGFREEIARANEREDVEVEIVATLPGYGARDKGHDATQDLLQSHPELDAIFAINDPSALGAVTALEKAGKLGEVKVIGFDGQPEGKEAIRAGKIYADPIQFPEEIARKTVEAIVAYFDGVEPEKDVLIPTALYRRADAERDPSLAGR